jgi:alkaline phosphatase D
MNRNILFAPLLLAATLSGCATVADNATNASSSQRSTAQAALRPYYEGLTQALPVAPKGAMLDANAPITRFAFGSCVSENRQMAFWDVIAAQKPAAFLLIGDNVYGDTGATGAADIPTLSASYRRLSSRAEFARFRQSVPMMTTWDDHDYGFNDGGGSFAFKEQAERIYESYWQSGEDVQSRPGVYTSQIVGQVGKRVQFILLDTRFFRSDLVRAPDRGTANPLGPYIANVDPKATLLGEAQWRWLAAELFKPAELRFIISSTQIQTDAHNFEGWTNLPKERDRLYAMLSNQGVSNAILLSGDRHAGAFYRTTIKGSSKPVYEMTSSSLNFAFGKGDERAKEPDPLRLGGFWTIPNFGQIDIDWTAKKVTLSLKKDDNSVIEQQVVRPFD